MLLKIDNQNILLTMSLEDKTKFLSMMDSINLKFEIIKQIIDNFNNKNAFYDFYCSNLFGKKNSNHLLIKIYGTSFDLYSLKIKHSVTSFEKEIQKNSLLNILFTQFDFKSFQKEMIDFEKYYDKLFKKYVEKPFNDNIKTINTLIDFKYNRNIIQFNLRSDIESNCFYLAVYAPQLNNDNVFYKSTYIKNNFSKLINLLNIDFDYLLNEFVQDDADHKEIKFKADIIFEKINLIENMNNF